jgi:hypothetical protein
MGASPLPLNLPRLTNDRFIAIHPGTGRPVAFGTVTAYVAGTNTLKSIYTDRAGDYVAENPIGLDAAGSAEFYGIGPYRLVVKDANGASVLDLDQVNSEVVEDEDAAEGTLLAINNLSDVNHVPTARESLGLAPQTSQLDATAGRLLTPGAFGLGGTAPEVTAANALNGIAVSGFVRVAAANVTTVAGPSGAGAGVVETIAYGSTQVIQIYHPVTGTSGIPWRRVNALGSWSDWRRDALTGNSGGTHFYERRASGTQDVWIIGQAFNYLGASRLRATITFPAAFVDINYAVTSTIRPATATANENTALNGLSDSDVGSLYFSVGGKLTTGLNVSIWRQTGSFVASGGGGDGDVIYADLHVVGRYLA